jgi:hypothetical protein
MKKFRKDLVHRINKKSSNKNLWSVTYYIQYIFFASQSAISNFGTSQDVPLRVFNATFACPPELFMNSSKLHSYICTALQVSVK